MSQNNQRIIDAAVVTYSTHYGNSERPLRLLVDADFERIHSLREELSQAWQNERNSTKLSYRDWKRHKLRVLGKSQKWHPTTLNLYSSIISKIINWDRNGLSQTDKKILMNAQAGVRLWSQFLKGHDKRLL